jgi:exonuclease III
MKIATWNVCLGLTTKKEIVSRTIVEEDIDICCIQEAEIPAGFPINELTFKNYSIEVEKNTFKQRVCIYIKTGINYKRREDLENENNHIVIIDVVAEKTYRIICLYRVFSTSNHVTPREKFNSQLKCISDSSVKNFIIMGDFNLDDSKKFEIDYVHKHLFA